MSAAYDLVLVAGGAGERLGGVVKAELRVGDERLVDRALAATQDALRRVVVGPDLDLPDDVVVTREDPPGGGPAAGVAAGLAAVVDPSPWTLLLASDVVDPAPGVRALLDAAGSLPADVDGVCLQGGDRPQWLFSLHRTESLRDAVRALADPAGASMHSLLSPLRLSTLEVEPEVVADIDTPEDRERHASAAPRGGPEDDATRERWRAWVELAAASVDVDPDDVDITAIHQMTKQIAHRYDRPLAPVGSYVLGLAVGAARARGEEVDLTALRRAVVATIEQAPPVPQEEP